MNSAKYNISVKRIYKNASSALNAFLQPAAGSNKLEFRPVAILRDPLKRAVSIYHQMGRMNLDKGLEFGPWLKYIIKNGFYDIHQMPQSWFVVDSTFLDYNFFDLDNLEEFYNFLGIEKGLELVNKGIDHINPEPFYHDIKRIYKEDFYLYQLIKMNNDN